VWSECHGLSFAYAFRLRSVVFRLDSRGLRDKESVPAFEKLWKPFGVRNACRREGLSGRRTVLLCLPRLSAGCVDHLAVHSPPCQFSSSSAWVRWVYTRHGALRRLCCAGKLPAPHANRRLAGRHFVGTRRTDARMPLLRDGARFRFELQSDRPALSNAGTERRYDVRP